MKGITKGMLLLSVTLCAIFAVTFGEKGNEPSYTKCRSHLECSPGECCTIGYERYSIPQCRPLQSDGEVCRPNGPTVTSGSRYYPDGEEIVLDNIYMMFCPCAEGLSCDRNGSVCRDTSRINQVVEQSIESTDD